MSKNLIIFLVLSCFWVKKILKFVPNLCFPLPQPGQCSSKMWTNHTLPTTKEPSMPCYCFINQEGASKLLLCSTYSALLKSPWSTWDLILQRLFLLNFYLYIYFLLLENTASEQEQQPSNTTNQNPHKLPPTVASLISSTKCYDRHWYCGTPRSTSGFSDRLASGPSPMNGKGSRKVLSCMSLCWYLFVRCSTSGRDG